MDCIKMMSGESCDGRREWEQQEPRDGINSAKQTESKPLLILGIKTYGIFNYIL